MKDGTAAIYCRLSKEDLDKDTGKTVSESIKNQKSMLEDYALERKWTVHDFYIDEDCSGSDRDRPEFNRLITDSLLGRFNIVLCKKQARFARDIEYVEKYIHGLFAERQIRFVAVLDNIDTSTVSRSARKASQINSLVDEWYLSDLSESIISALNTKRRNAEFIGSWAPYGYCKNPENKNALIVDSDAATIVKMIFERYLNGLGISRIAQELNDGHIPNPLLYKKLKGEKINPNPDKLTEKRYLWSPSCVSAVLHNQTYTGCLVQGKYKKASYKSKKLLRIPKTDWIIIPYCHEPIIDSKTWTAVQKMLALKSRIPHSKHLHPASGIVFCGECGSKLVLSGGRSGSRKTAYYCCSKHKLSINACIGARIETARLEQLLLEQIRSLSGRFYDETFLLELVHSEGHCSIGARKELKAESNSLREHSDLLCRKKEIIYYDRLNGLITTEEFLGYKEMLEKESAFLLERQQEINDRLSRIEEHDTGLSISQAVLDCCKAPVALTRDMTVHLIESVYVRKRMQGEPQQITINWNF